MNENIDEVKLKRMLVSVLCLERKNCKTKKFTKNEMIDKIQKIIEEEAKKCL